MGFEPHMFSEIEFYIVDKKTGEPVDQASYCSLPPLDVSYNFRHELDEVCNYCKINVKRIHHECGPG
jgi:glutamine synthetase